MKASTAMASPAEMSSCAVSAAHESRKAAATMAVPNSTASTPWSSEVDVRRRTTAGTVATTASARETRWRTGWTSRRSSAVEVTRAS